MNKLDAISRRGGKMRVLVGAVRGTLLACVSAGLVIAVAKLPFKGGITLAYEAVDPTVSVLQTSPVTVTTKATLPDTAAFPRILPPDEAAVSALFEEPEEDAQRPGAVRPDGWTGNAVSYDEEGNVFLYGQPVVPMTGTVTAADGTSVGGVLSAHEAVGDDFFRNTVVIGNSQVVGMQKSGLFPADYYASIGLSVRQFFEKPNMPVTADDGSTVYVSTAEALARNNDFKKVYLLFGINELGWSIEGFVGEYETLIDTILTIRPDAEIYVQAILPMNEEVYRTSEDPQEFFTNERITRFNASIASLAARKQVFFLTPGEILLNEYGEVPADAVPSDGIHLSTPYIRAWVDYLKTHTAH